MEGFNDWNFKYSNGGVDKTPPKCIKHRYFQALIIKMPYTITFYPVGILGIYAVDLVRPSANTTNMISFHQYLSAN